MHLIMDILLLSLMSIMGRLLILCPIQTPRNMRQILTPHILLHHEVHGVIAEERTIITVITPIMLGACMEVHLLLTSMDLHILRPLTNIPHTTLTISLPTLNIMFTILPRIAVDIQSLRCRLAMQRLQEESVSR